MAYHGARVPLIVDFFASLAVGALPHTSNKQDSAKYNSYMSWVTVWDV